MRSLPLAALLTAAVLSGCGADAVEEAPSLDEVAAATRSHPYHFDHTLEVEGTATPMTATGSGAADPEARRGVVRYRFEQDEQTATLEVRQIQGDTYTRFSAPGYPGRWGEEGTAEADRLVGPFGPFSEPHQAVDALGRHGRDVESEPGEPIDGSRTTHFRATVPTVELLGGGLTQMRRRELEEELRRTRSESAEVEAWAGDDGLLRKLEFSIPITEDGDRGRARSTTRFYDFGRPVVVTPPPAEPCATGAGPHSADAVLEALRDAGFTANARCGRETATILASPQDGAAPGELVVCVVEHRPEPPVEDEAVVVSGNVVCHAGTPELLGRARKALDGL